MANPLHDDTVIVDFKNYQPLTMGEGLKLLLRLANKSPGPARNYVASIDRYGVTNSLISKLNGFLGAADFSAHPRYIPSENDIYWVWSEESAFEWLYDADVHATKGDVDLLLAWVIIALIKVDAFRHLKRCAATDCSNFHARRGKWCSDNCGSKHRVREKRKRDKQRQML